MIEKFKEKKKKEKVFHKWLAVQRSILEALSASKFSVGL